jgi:hypothetical protein
MRPLRALRPRYFQSALVCFVGSLLLLLGAAAAAAQEKKDCNSCASIKDANEQAACLINCYVSVPVQGLGIGVGEIIKHPDVDDAPKVTVGNGQGG